MTDLAPRQGAYPTLDAFFTRPLRPGARTIGQARVVSPADGALVALGRIEREARFRRCQRCPHTSPIQYGQSLFE
jgi:phosphatidylserine decarboxylase